MLAAHQCHAPGPAVRRLLCAWARLACAPLPPLPFSAPSARGASATPWDQLEAEIASLRENLVALAAREAGSRAADADAAATAAAVADDASDADTVSESGLAAPAAPDGETPRDGGAAPPTEDVVTADGWDELDDDDLLDDVDANTSAASSGTPDH